MKNKTKNGGENTEEQSVPNKNSISNTCKINKRLPVKT